MSAASLQCSLPVDTSTVTLTPPPAAELEARSPDGSHVRERRGPQRSPPWLRGPLGRPSRDESNLKRSSTQAVQQCRRSAIPLVSVGGPSRLLRDPLLRPSGGVLAFSAATSPRSSQISPPPR